MNLLSAKEAADKLGVDSSRIRQFILEGRLPAQKIGNSYVINEADLALVADRKPGRPKKVQPPVTQIQFYETVERLLSEVGEEFGISFKKFSLTVLQENGYKRGNWTWSETQFNLSNCRVYSHSLEER